MAFPCQQPGGTAKAKMWGRLWQETFTSARIKTPPSKHGIHDRCILSHGTCPFEERPNPTTVGEAGWLS